MFSAQPTSRSKAYNQRLSYRYFTRQVLVQPMNMDIHTSRVMVALELPEKEPLQGALADMFYGCWYDVPFFGERMLGQVTDKLHEQTLQQFQACIDKREYIETVSKLATRWSVLTSPSMSAYSHQLRASSDDARAIAEHTVAELLDEREEAEGDYEDPAIIAIEDEFFAHCHACDDRLAFSLVWWQLSKNGWEFSPRWTHARHQLEQKPLEPVFTTSRTQN